MTDPAITAAPNKLIAETPPPVTVWGVRYTQSIFGTPGRLAAGHIDWCDSEAEAREWLAEWLAAGNRVELVRITGRVHPADTTAASGADR